MFEEFARCMQMFYPVSEVFSPMTFAAPPPEAKDLRILPSISLLSTGDAPVLHGPAASRHRSSGELCF